MKKISNTIDFNSIDKIIGLSFVFVFIDQIIKFIISNNIKLNSEIKVIDKFFNITNVHNDGAAFSIFSGNVIFLIIMPIVALAVTYLFFIKGKELSKLDFILNSMLIGGAIGNFIDRMIFKHVIDYLEFIIFGYYFPIFNFADICIVLSSIIMIVVGIKEDICNSSKLKMS